MLPRSQGESICDVGRRLKSRGERKKKKRMDVAFFSRDTRLSFGGRKQRRNRCRAGLGFDGWAQLGPERQSTSFKKALLLGESLLAS